MGALFDHGVPAQARGRGRWPTLKVAIPAGLLILILGACLLWPLVYPVPNPLGGNVLESNLPPLSPGHLLGTDPAGKDVLSRALYGGRVSFEVGLAVNAIGLVVGGLLGMIAGYGGGALDATVMRMLDVLIAFPALVLAIAIAEGLGPIEFHVILALSVFGIPAFGRLARAATLAMRERTFILAARLADLRAWRGAHDRAGVADPVYAAVPGGGTQRLPVRLRAQHQPAR